MSTQFNLSEYVSLGFFAMDIIDFKLASMELTVPGEFVQELDEKAQSAGVQEVELFVPKSTCSIAAKDCQPQVVIVCSVNGAIELGDDNPDKCHMVQVCDGNNENCQFVMACDNSLRAATVTPKGCRPVVVIVCSAKAA